MRLHRPLKEWWQKKPANIRKPLAFGVGIVLIILSPVVGLIPGPGGIIVFLAAIAVLASEFDWAENLQAFFLKTVPSEVKKRWRPTPLWQIIFDASAIALLTGSGFAIYQQFWAPALSLGIGGLCLLLFNRERLARLKRFVQNK